MLGHCKKKSQVLEVFRMRKKNLQWQGVQKEAICLGMQFYFLNKKWIVGSGIQTLDRIVMPSSINEKYIYLKKIKSLNFYATLGENNEGCQELS